MIAHAQLIEAIIITIVMYFVFHDLWLVIRSRPAPEVQEYVRKYVGDDKIRVRVWKSRTGVATVTNYGAMILPPQILDDEPDVVHTIILHEYEHIKRKHSLKSSLSLITSAIIIMVSAAISPLFTGVAMFIAMVLFDWVVERMEDDVHKDTTLPGAKGTIKWD